MTDIRPVGTADMPLLLRGLRALGEELGDPYALPDRDIAAAVTGPDACARALVAGRETPAGIAMYTPLVSTSMGATGAFVSDLWVAPDARGSGLARQLLAAVLRQAKADWRAEYLRLAVYEHSAGAQAFYLKLGFERRAREHAMILPPGAAKILEAFA